MTARSDGRPGVLIEPTELASQLAGPRPPTLLDVRWTLGGPPGRSEFEADHLPGAHWVDLERQLSAPPGRGGRHPLPPAEDFAKAMSGLGLAEDTPVVVYDAATSMAAARLWWLLTDAGHSSVRVLNGGIAAWRAAGLEVATGAAPPPTAGNLSPRAGRRARVGAAEILDGLSGSAGATLVDVRAPERYRGEVEPIDPVAGHIPGALNLPSTGNVDATGRFLAPETLRERFAGLQPDAILYCGSGVTAAHTLLAMESAGLTARIYPGSWSDWITDPARPIATGVDP